VTFDSKVSRRDFLKFLAAGASTIAFGSVLGFSSFFSTNKNGRSGIGGSGGIPQAAAQSAPGTFVLGPNTGNISIHAATLTNGKVFYAAGSGFHSLYQDEGPFHWNTFDPATGSITNHTVGKDIFCMGQAVLPNGKVLCAGGTVEYDVGDSPDGKWKGLKAAYEYDPSSNSLDPVQDMQHGRWYPHCIVLEDGKVLTIGGWDELGCKNSLAEIYDPDSKSWSIKYDSTGSITYCVGGCPPFPIPGQPCYGGPGQGALSNLSLYPRAVLMPTGLVAVAGMEETTKTWNPQTGQLKFAGNLSGKIKRNYGNMVLLPLNNDPAETGQLLVCGGSPSPGHQANTHVEILTPNPSTNNSTFTFQTIAPCNFGRRHAPNAYLPDGNIIFFGGTIFQNSLAGAHFNAEIFDPVTELDCC
jgi:cold shock CspA family protein